MIGIVDYGMGNLRSVQRAFEHEGCDVVVTSDRSMLEKAEGIVFPGQGAFRDAMKNVAEYGLEDFLRKWMKNGRPFLGICMGLQLLFTESEEGGKVRGLDLIEGAVRRFPPGQKVPQMGWNSVKITDGGQGCPLLEGIAEGSYFYFVHSYYVDPVDRGIVALETDYGIRYTSMVWKDNLYAVQFHPEKSQDVGLKMISNFKGIVYK